MPEAPSSSPSSGPAVSASGLCRLFGSFATVGGSDFEFIPAATLPLFLFSATFYPVSAYGDWAWVVQLSPLYHGVALVRDAALGTADWGILGHCAYLLVMAVVGLRVAGVRLGTLLRT
ncbi:ABC transporter permease [Ilumatobacteraceae bacterium]|nr:ABC transporter permease [Ilumatobacteraceae bacterium]